MSLSRFRDDLCCTLTMMVFRGQACDGCARQCARTLKICCGRRNESVILPRRMWRRRLTVATSGLRNALVLVLSHSTPVTSLEINGETPKNMVACPLDDEAIV